jgi:lysylphosphatidylglycerol synthetase-like protein (DUF2156 family)
VPIFAEVSNQFAPTDSENLLISSAGTSHFVFGRSALLAATTITIEGKERKAMRQARGKGGGRRQRDRKKQGARRRGRRRGEGKGRRREV